MDEDLFINLFWLDENLHPVIGVCIFLFLHWSAQGISKGVLSSGSILDQEVESGEELCPSSLSGVQFLGCHEILQGSVISQYLKTFIDL